MISPRARRRHGAAALVLVIVSAAGLAGCGSDEPQPTLELDGPSSSETTSADPAEPSGAPDDAGPVPRDPPDGAFTRGLSPAGTAEQEAVADTWFAYWEEVTRMYRDGGEEDRDALYALATGQAASGPLAYAEDMRAAGNTQAGGGIGSITSVRVDGLKATVRGCFRDTSYDVGADGEPVEVPAEFFATEDTLRKEGPDWRMVEQTIPQDSVGRPCAYR